MISKIDWISFTLSIDPIGQERWKDLYGNVQDRIRTILDSAAHFVLDGSNWHAVIGRAPYTFAWQRADHGVTIFASPTQPHFLVEISGIGCGAPNAAEDGWLLLNAVKDHVTRLDVAADMLCNTSPSEFTKVRDTKRFKAWSEMVSETGHTVYIGSKQSDRFARVYRYNAPHPRSAFLRAEHVLRREQAKLAANRILDLGLLTFVAEIGNSFGWTHEQWRPDVLTDLEARAWRPERSAGNTVRWMYAQVLPALVKLDGEGALDVRAWFETEVLPKLQPR